MANTKEMCNSFAKIREGAKLLPDIECENNGLMLDLGLEPIVKIERKRYEKLIKAEVMLDSIIEIQENSSYSSEVAQLISIFKKMRGTENESESE